MAYIDTGDSQLWFEATPSRNNTGAQEFFDYYLIIVADDEHEIELDVDSRSEIMHELIQTKIDEWVEKHDSTIKEIHVYERKMIRTGSQESLRDVQKSEETTA